MVVTREPEFDDAERGAWLRLQEYEDSIDSNTNLPAHDAYKDQMFAVDAHTNFAARVLAAERRRLQKDAQKKNGGTLPEDWEDGLQLIVRVATEADLRKESSAH